MQVEGRALEGALPGRQGRLLLAYLVWHRERACPRPELIDVLWPEEPPLSSWQRRGDVTVLHARSERSAQPDDRA